MRKSMCLAALLLSANAVAKDYDYAVGVSTTVANYSYEDADGETKSESVRLPIALFGEMKLSRVNKLFVGLRSIDFDTDASRSGDIGATIEGTQVEVAWLHKVRLARHFKPWFGVGIRSNILEVSDKHAVDGDGFLIEEFADTEDSFLSAVLKVNADWEIGEGWFIDAGAAYDQPVGDGLSGYSVTTGIKYEM